MGSNASNLTRDGKMEADCITEGQLHCMVLTILGQVVQSWVKITQGKCKI